MIVDLGRGVLLRLDPADRQAEKMLLRLAEVMGSGARLRSATEQRQPRQFSVRCAGNAIRVETGVPGASFVFSAESLAAAEQRSTFVGDAQLFQLVALSLVIGAECHRFGGILLHGALAVSDGSGVLLLGPSGRGKSTASRRIGAPWESLSDDMALVVPGAACAWRAHPWPTWSSFREGGSGGACDVQRGVELGGLFFISWADANRAERIGSGRAACLLVESFRQSWWAGDALFPAWTMKEIHGQAFDIISALARGVPAFVLHMSPDGPFWEKIEEALADVRCAV